MKIEKVATEWTYKVYCGKNHLMTPCKDKTYRCQKCSETCTYEEFDHLKDGGMN